MTRAPMTALLLKSSAARWMLLQCALSAGLYDTITPHDNMNDARLDALMAVWPEYAAVVEEEYRAKIAPLWHEA